MRPVARWSMPLAFLFLLSPALADADVLTGRIYAIGASGRQLLFTWQLERDTGSSSWRSFYRTPGGDLTAADELLWDGEDFKSYRYERPSVGETARVDRHGEELFYEQHVNGVTRRNRERFDERVAVGPTVILWAQRHWNELAAGRDLTVRYAVLDQLRTFEF